jgi:hypothetical protein
MVELDRIQIFDDCRIARRLIVVGVLRHDGNCSVDFREWYKAICRETPLENDAT